MYKITNKLSPTLVQELFPIYENPYNLRNERCWQTSNVRTVGFGTETLLFRGSKNLATSSRLNKTFKHSPRIENKG